MIQQSPTDVSRHSQLRQLAPLLSLGLELAVTVLGGGAVGWFVDSSTGMRPLWTVVGFVLGIAAAIVHFARAVHRLEQKNSHRASQSVDREQPPHGGIR